MAKKTPVTFRGKILAIPHSADSDQNVLRLNEKREFDRWLNTTFKPGQEVNVRVTAYRRTRTSGQPGEQGNQNGYYWKVVIPILCEHTGYTSEEMHSALKYKFLRYGGDDQLPRIRESSTLQTDEWEDWMQNIRMWAADELACNIPLPNELDWED